MLDELARPGQFSLFLSFVLDKKDILALNPLGRDNTFFVGY